MLSAPDTALAGLAAHRIPPRTGASHASVVAFHHLNRGTARLSKLGGRADVLEQALVAPEAAEVGHLHGRRYIVDLSAAPAAFHVDIRRGAHVIRRHKVIGVAAECGDDLLRGAL